MNVRISVNRNKNPVPPISLPLTISIRIFKLINLLSRNQQLFLPIPSLNFLKKYIYLFIYYLFMS